MSDNNLTIFANRPNKLSFNVEVIGVQQSSLQPRLSIFCNQVTLSFPLKHNNEHNWVADIECGFQDVGVCSAKGKVEIICNGHFLESDEFDVEIKGDVKVQQHKPTEAPSEAPTVTPVVQQPTTTNFKIDTTQSNEQPKEQANVPEKSKQRTDEQEVNKDAVVRDLLQSMGIATKRSKFKHKALRDYIPD